MIDMRLQAVARYVPAGARLADIGTDHAYLLIWLMRQGRLAAAYGVECTEGPFRMARESVKNSGMTQIDLRLGDGLEPIISADFDTVTIAGMGGTTMIGILERSREVWPRLRRLILQPMTGEARLRRWALEEGWILAEEDLVAEGGRLYQIIVLEHRGEATISPHFTEFEMEVGPLLLREPHPLLELHLQTLLARCRSIVKQMGNSEEARDSLRYQTQIALIHQLEERLA